MTHPPCLNVTMNGSARTDIEAIAADWLARRDGGDWSQADADALDAWLDRFPDAQGRRFTSLAHALTAAHNPIDCVAHAGALGQWRKDVIRGGQ